MAEEIVRAAEPGGLALLAELERNGWLTLTSIDLPPDAVTYDQFDALMHWAAQLHESSCWLIGDLINYGEKVYGQTYAQAMEATGLAEQTLTNYASVCGRIPRSRRRLGLKFGVHAEVAYMPPKERDQWLKTAATNGWGRSRLREELAPARKAARETSADDPVRAENGAEILPPDVESHVCQCAQCGRVMSDV